MLLSFLFAMPAAISLLASFIDMLPAHYFAVFWLRRV